MTHKSKQANSINHFISNIINSKSLDFPEQEINKYCKKKQLSLSKIENVLNGYFEKFKRTYQNLQQIILLFYVIIIKLDEINSSNNATQQYFQMEYAVLLRSLNFIQDLITSKLWLVCQVSRSKNKEKVSQNLSYLNKLLIIITPKMLQFEMSYQIMTSIQNINQVSCIKNFVSINFILEYMFIQRIVDNLQGQSQVQFKQFLYSVMAQDKIIFMEDLWTQNSIQQQNKLDFSEIAYLRLNLQSPEINFLQISANGKVMVYEVNTLDFQERWINQSYERTLPVTFFDTMKQLNIQNALDIYQFLFKLQVFASSPKIQDLDFLINNDDFLDIFGKFLIGQNLVSKIVRQERSVEAVQTLKNIIQMIQSLDPFYQQIVKQEVNKLLQKQKQEHEDDSLQNQYCDQQ